MQISVDELRIITNKLLEWLVSYRGGDIDVTDKFYWNIPEEQLYNMNHEPTKLDVGQLSDDWQELRKLLDENRLPIRQEFVWLAALFRAIGESET